MSKAAGVGFGIAALGGIAALLKGLAVGGAKIGTAAKFGAVGAAGIGASHVDDLARLGINLDDAGRLLPNVSRSADDIATPPLVHESESLSAAAPNMDEMRAANVLSDVQNEDALTIASANESSNEILLVAPTDDASFERMFGAQDAAGKYASVRRDLQAFDNVLSVVKPDDASSVLFRVRHSDADYLTVVGHNEDGVLVLPDGSRLPLSDLASECAGSGKQCIILSCSSRRFVGSSDGAIGVDGELTYADAAQVARKVQKYLDSMIDRKATFTDLSMHLDEVVLDAEGQLATARVMKLAVYPIGGAGAGTGGLMLVEQRE